jgi:hypothetical protein
MPSVLISWKTTLVGVVLLVIAGLKAYGVDVPGFSGDVGTLVAAALAAIFAKDANVGPTK